jgi:Flp pilus assembly protein TadD
MARIQAQKGSLANALELVDQAAVLYRSEGVPEGFHLLRGDILARMDRLPEAEVEMREEIRLHPRAVPPRISLALVLASRGRMAEARRMVVETAAANPRLDAFVKGAAALDYFGDRAGAEALRRRGHALYPDDPRLKSGS